MRTLVVGFGNPDRQDDGAAWQVIASLRRRLGQAPLEEEDTGLDSLGGEIDSIQLLQLGPELLDVAAGYERLIFVDAGAPGGPGSQAITWSTVEREAAPAAFTHHMTPAMFLALLEALYRRRPAGLLLTVPGQQFDFRRGLSAATATLVEPAAAEILRLLGI